MRMEKNAGDQKHPWKYTGRTQTGTRHKKRRMLCQDQLAYAENEFAQAAVLLDGFGHTDRNAIACEAIAKYLAEDLCENLASYLTEDPEQIKRTILLKVYRMIEQEMKKSGLPKEEFASTIMALGIDYQSERYLMLHLGDGVIASTGEETEILSWPENGFATFQTHLTVSDHAFRKLRINRGDIGKRTGFLLATDGMYRHPLQIEQINDMIHGTQHHGVSMEDDQGMVFLCKSI